MSTEVKKDLVSLDQVLSYKNDEVVFRFSEDFGFSKEDSEELFLETKRWLWLCAHRISRSEGKPSSLPLFSEANAIDLMWHTFLLFTQDYSEFCLNHFGCFVHHHPTPRAEKEKAAHEMTDNPEGYRTQRLVQFREVYEYIYDHLGPEILKKWCEELPSKFAEGKFQEQRESLH